MLMPQQSLSLLTWHDLWPWHCDLKFSSHDREYLITLYSKFHWIRNYTFKIILKNCWRRRRQWIRCAYVSLFATQTRQKPLIGDKKSRFSLLAGGLYVQVVAREGFIQKILYSTRMSGKGECDEYVWYSLIYNHDLSLLYQFCFDAIHFLQPQHIYCLSLSCILYTPIFFLWRYILRIKGWRTNLIVVLFS